MAVGSVWTAIVRHGAAVLSGGAAAALAFAALTPSEPASAQGDVTGLVVSHIEFALSVDDGAANSGACPSGLSGGSIDLYKASHPEQAERQADETERQYAQRLSQHARVNANGENICLNPTAAGPDPLFHTVSGDVRAHGMDLDNRSSRDNFRGVSGSAHSVDNQFYRVMGCVHSFQPRGAFNLFGNEMILGHWGILIALKGVDDRVNDPDVEVELLANSEPIQLGADRTPVANATYVAEDNPRFSATARGRIVNGVLTTDPVDFVFHQSISNYAIRLEREFRHARIQLTLAPDGSAEGYLGGYTPIEHLYANHFSYAAATGGESPDQLVQSVNLMRDNIPQSHGYTCNGVHAALVANADGDPDPATGRNTSISMQYRIRAVPAFVLKNER